MSHSLRLLIATIAAVLLLPAGLLLFAASNNGWGYTPVQSSNIDFKWQDIQGSYHHFSELESDAILVFFGFFSCSDICPIRIQQLWQLDQALDNQLHPPAVDMMFITIGPKNDSVAVRNTMIDQRSQRMFSAELTDAALEKLQNEFTEQVRQFGEQILHAGNLYLLNRHKQLVKVYTHMQLPAEILLSDISELD